MRSPWVFLLLVGLSLSPFVVHADATSIPYFGPIVPSAVTSTCAAAWGAVVQLLSNAVAFFVTLAIVFVAPLMLAYAGFLFVVNPVNAGGINQAKGILIHTITGIVIALCAWLLVNTILSVISSQGLTGWTQGLSSGGSASCLSLNTNTGVTTQPGSTNPGVTSSPGSTGTTTNPNIQNGINTLDANAAQNSIPGNGQCATYIREALAAEGYSNFNGPLGINAAQYGTPLTADGFSTVSSDNYTPQTGDVVVIQPYAGDPNNYGHVEMWNGSNWVSDYVQNGAHSGIYPSAGYQNGQASYTIYRPPGG